MSLKFQSSFFSNPTRSVTAVLVQREVKKEKKENGFRQDQGQDQERSHLAAVRGLIWVGVLAFMAKGASLSRMGSWVNRSQFQITGVLI